MVSFHMKVYLPGRGERAKSDELSAGVPQEKSI